MTFLPIVNVFAVTYAGMWFGLTCQKEGQAAARTILWVLIAPMFSWIISCLGIPLLYIAPIIWIAVCGNKLRSRLRPMITRRHELSHFGAVSKSAVEPGPSARDGSVV